MGYLPEQPPLYLDRTPREYLTFVAQAKGVPAGELTMQIDRVMAETGISHVAGRLIKNLSKGYRQRVGIAQALLGDLKVIILDEPTVGLDPKQMVEIRSLIQALGKEHMVILSSHILSEVQEVCQKILIISSGKLVACDTPENLERLFAGSTQVALTVEAGQEELQTMLQPLELQSLQITAMTPQRCGVTLETIGGEDDVCRKLFFLFAEAGKPILRMTTSRASLEDIFLELTGGGTDAASMETEQASPASAEAVAQAAKEELQ